MNQAILKTLTLVLLIALGLLLKVKFLSKEKINGIKEIILSVALPSTIFIALLKIKLDISLLFIPFITILFNLVMFFLTPILLKQLGFEKESSTSKTLTLLIPSLAPGLSCFPFIIEFLGQESLALAAMADIGNKFFGLIFLYLIAMNLSMETTGGEAKNTKDKIISLLGSLVKEPINIILFLGIMLLSFGVSFQSLPTLVQGLFNKTSALMTPLVLVFIGLAVKFKSGNKRLVLSLMFIRAGFSLILSAVFILSAGISNQNLVLLILVFPLSSISFWPFAHMSLFNGQEEEKNIPTEKRTFNIELAIMVLALSLPFSTTIILTILTAGTYFLATWKVLILAFSLIILGLAPLLSSKLPLLRPKRA